MDATAFAFLVETKAYLDNTRHPSRDLDLRIAKIIGEAPMNAVRVDTVEHDPGTEWETPGYSEAMAAVRRIADRDARRTARRKALETEAMGICAPYTGDQLNALKALPDAEKPDHGWTITLTRTPEGAWSAHIQRDDTHVYRGESGPEDRTGALALLRAILSARVDAGRRARGFAAA